MLIDSFVYKNEFKLYYLDIQYLMRSHMIISTSVLILGIPLID